MVELCEVLGNVSEAGRRLGVSRHDFYDIKRTLQQEGVEGLLENAMTKPRVSNRIAPEIEERVLACSLEIPIHGQFRVENQLKIEGFLISACGLSGVRLRHGLARKALRLKCLEKRAAETQGILTEEQVRALESKHTRPKARHPQTNGMTEKLNQTIQEEFYAVAFRKRLSTGQCTSYERIWMLH